MRELRRCSLYLPCGPQRKQYSLVSNHEQLFLLYILIDPKMLKVECLQGTTWLSSLGKTVPIQSNNDICSMHTN